MRAFRCDLKADFLFFCPLFFLPNGGKTGVSTVKYQCAAVPSVLGGWVARWAVAMETMSGVKWHTFDCESVKSEGLKREKVESEEGMWSS